MTPKMDVHLAKGKRVQRAIESALQNSEMMGAIKFCGAIAFEVARDSRLEAARRMKRAKHHAKTLDIFE